MHYHLNIAIKSIRSFS